MTDAGTPAPPERPPTGADPLPRHTTPTWEVELLISGVTVFAMLQLPGWLDDRYFDLLPRFEADWHLVLLSMYLYLRCTAVILAITFVLHLLLRARWIALVGLDSVYPDGVRWDRVRLGPVARAIAQRRMGAIADTVDRADNSATIVFAVGVQMALITLRLALMVAVSTAIALLVGTIHPGTGLGTLAGMLLALFLLPFFAALILDRRLGARLAPAGRVVRWTGAILSTYSRAGFMQNASPGALLISSHRGGRASSVAMLAILLCTAALTVIQVQAGQDPAAIGNYGSIPAMVRDSADVVRADHYDDQRDGHPRAGTPSIQSLVVTGPYLHLTVPVDPAGDNPVLRQHCVALAHPIKDPAGQRRAVLDCLGELHPVQLDGRVVTGLRYVLGTDATTRRPALLALVDVRALAPGRHALRVGRPDRTPADAADDHPNADVIAFWR